VNGVSDGARVVFCLPWKASSANKLQPVVFVALFSQEQL
jgi:hypothetical protein